MSVSGNLDVAGRHTVPVRTDNPLTMCVATTAARNAHGRLEVAVAFLNSGNGKSDSDRYYPDVSAAMNAQAGVLTRRRLAKGPGLYRRMCTTLVRLSRPS